MNQVQAESGDCYQIIRHRARLHSHLPESVCRDGLQANCQSSLQSGLNDRPRLTRAKTLLLIIWYTLSFEMMSCPWKTIFLRNQVFSETQVLEKRSLLRNHGTQETKLLWNQVFGANVFWETKLFLKNRLFEKPRFFENFKLSFSRNRAKIRLQAINIRMWMPNLDAKIWDLFLGQGGPWNHSCWEFLQNSQSCAPLGKLKPNEQTNKRTKEQSATGECKEQTKQTKEIRKRRKQNKKTERIDKSE